MNEEVLTNIGEQVLGWLRASEELVVTQAPLLAEEIVFRGQVHSVTMLVLSLFLTGAGAYLARRGVKRVNENEPDEAFGWFLAAAVPSLLGGIGAMIQVKAVILVFCAPRLYLLKVVSSLL